MLSNHHQKDFRDMQVLARVAVRELDPGSLQSLLVRRIGFPYKQGSKLMGRQRYVVIVQITEDAAQGNKDDASATERDIKNRQGRLKARWLYTEWTGKPGAKDRDSDDRLIVATGSFKTETRVSDHRVNIESVALGVVEPMSARTDPDELSEKITFKGAARVAGSGGVTFKSEELTERRFFSLASPFSGDGRANCSVFMSALPNGGVEPAKETAVA